MQAAQVIILRKLSNRSSFVSSECVAPRLCRWLETCTKCWEDPLDSRVTHAMEVRQQGFLSLHMWNQRHGSYPPCSYDISINHIVSSESVAPRLRPRMQRNTNGREDPLYSSITDATAVVCASVCDPAPKTLAPRQSRKPPGFPLIIGCPSLKICGGGCRAIRKGEKAHLCLRHRRISGVWTP